MRRRPSPPIPQALDRLRGEIEQWRGQPSGRKRLPRELWAQAVTLASPTIAAITCALKSSGRFDRAMMFTKSGYWRRKHGKPDGKQFC